MSTEQILSLLVAEKERIERAIAALSGSKSAGRAPGAGSGRKARTPEQRAAQSEKMKAYWAARRASAAKGKKK